MLQLTLLPEVRTTLAAAFRLAGLVRIDFSHDFSLAVKEQDLLDFELADYIKGRLDEAGPGGKIALVDPELLFLFALLDLFCKSYFTSFSEILEKEHRAATGGDEDAFRAQRDRYLSMAGRILQHIAQNLSTHPGMAELREKLALLEETMK